jgi:hypothetical protein
MGRRCRCKETLLLRRLQPGDRLQLRGKPTRADQASACARVGPVDLCPRGVYQGCALAPRARGILTRAVSPMAGLRFTSAQGRGILTRASSSWRSVPVHPHARGEYLRATFPVRRAPSVGYAASALTGSAECTNCHHARCRPGVEAPCRGCRRRCRV